MTSPTLHVVLGAGPLGLSLAEQLLAEGHVVRLVSRSASKQSGQLAQAQIFKADVARLDEARAACAGAGVVYHCAVPAYMDWVASLEPLMAGILEGAAASGARLVYGDNLYAYGPVTGALHEGLPEVARDRKGAARARAAAMLLEAHRSGRVQATIGRAADFYGPRVRNSSMGERVFLPLLRKGRADVVGNPNLPHTFTYLPDFARAMVTLGNRQDALGRVWHVPNAPTLTARAFIEEIAAQLGVPPRISAIPGWGMRLLGLFSPVLREVAEMMYQFELPFQVDHGEFLRTFGGEVTSHREGIARTIEWYRSFDLAANQKP